MGCFDSVMVRCPKCGVEVEFQSKAGECTMARYGVDSIPIDIARNLDGRLKECDCGHVLQLSLEYPIPRTTRMVVD